MIGQGLAGLHAPDLVIAGRFRIEPNDQRVLQVEPRVRPRCLQGRAQQQGSAEDQDYGQRDLARYRKTAALAVDGPQHTTGGSLHLLGQITPGQPQSRS